MYRCTTHFANVWGSDSRTFGIYYTYADSRTFGIYYMYMYVHCILVYIIVYILPTCSEQFYASLLLNVVLPESKPQYCHHMRSELVEMVWIWRVNEMWNSTVYYLQSQQNKTTCIYYYYVEFSSSFIRKQWKRQLFITKLFSYMVSFWLLNSTL